MTRVIFHRQAQSDLTSTLKYYEKFASREVANQFLVELRSCTNRVSQNPEGFILVSPVLRRANLRRFPFYLLYYLIEDRIKVTAVAHNRRNPSYGTKRR